MDVLDYFTIEETIVTPQIRLLLGMVLDPSKGMPCMMFTPRGEVDMTSIRDSPSEKERFMNHIDFLEKKQSEARKSRKNKSKKVSSQERDREIAIIVRERENIESARRERESVRAQKAAKRKEESKKNISMENNYKESNLKAAVLPMHYSSNSSSEEEVEVKPRKTKRRDAKVVDDPVVKVSKNFAKKALKKAAKDSRKK